MITDGHSVESQRLTYPSWLMASLLTDLAAIVNLLCFMFEFGILVFEHVYYKSRSSCDLLKLVLVKVKMQLQSQYADVLQHTEC